MKLKRVISEIIINKEKMEDLSKILSSNKFSLDAKRSKQKHLTGECCMCLAIPNKLITYDMGGAKKIERYCDMCFEKWESE
jgi:hypothetical protein